MGFVLFHPEMKGSLAPWPRDGLPGWGLPITICGGFSSSLQVLVEFPLSRPERSSLLSSLEELEAREAIGLSQRHTAGWSSHTLVAPLPVGTFAARVGGMRRNSLGQRLSAG